MTHAKIRAPLWFGIAVTLCAVSPSPAAAQRGVRVHIESTPPGATVYLDHAEGTPLGLTPLRDVRISAGPHTLIFRMTNHEEERVPIQVRRVRETFRATLRALGAIEISAGNDAARGADVRIDGEPAGSGVLGPVAVRVDNVQPGRHQVVVTRDGYNRFEEWVEVAGNEVVRITARLEAVSPTVGSILVSADVQGAPIFLDDREVGRTSTLIENVPAGNHTLEIRPEGEERTRPFTQQVLVQQGERVRVQAVLRRPSPTVGTIAIITELPTARVRIDGTELDAGSFSRESLSPGSHVVQVLAEGYHPFRREVDVTAGETTFVEAELDVIAVPVAPPPPEPEPDDSARVRFGGEAGANVLFGPGDLIMAGGHAAIRIGLQFNKRVGLYYQATGVIGQWVSGNSMNDDVLGALYNSPMVEITFPFIHIAAGPSVDMQLSGDLLGDPDDFIFFGVGAKAAVVIGGTGPGRAFGFSFNVHPHLTFGSDHVRFSILFGLGAELF